MENFTAAKLGKGKVVHAMHTANATLKGSMVGGCTGGDTAPCEDPSAKITCKRCLNALPSWDTTTDHSAPEAAAEVEAGQTWISTDSITETVKVDGVAPASGGLFVRYTLTSGARIGNEYGLHLDSFLKWFTRAPEVVLRIRDSRTGVVRRILGTAPATNAPHLTMVWVQREGEQGATPWRADELMSTWHDLVAVDANGDTVLEAAHREALELAAARTS